MSSKHSFVTELEIEIPEAEEVFYPKIEILYTYTPGYEATRDEPGASPEIEIYDVKVINSLGLEYSSKEWLDLADEWMDEGGYDLLADQAEEDSEPDPDYEYDRRRDEGL